MRLFSLFAALVLSACSSTRLLARTTLDPSSSRAFLFSSVNVFDGDAALGPRDVRVKDGKVLTVAEPGSLQAEAGEEKLDGAGLTLMPGLIDSHAHIESNGEPIWAVGMAEADDIAQAYVYAGVTTTLVMTGDESQRTLERRAEQGELIAPRMYRTGPRLTAPDGFPMNLMRALLVWPLSSMVIGSVMRSAANADEARAAVNETADELAPPFYKITCDSFPPGAPKLSAEAMTAAIQQAKARGIRSAAHVGAPEDAMIAAEAGAVDLRAPAEQRAVHSGAARTTRRAQDSLRQHAALSHRARAARGGPGHAARSRDRRAEAARRVQQSPEGLQVPAGAARAGRGQAARAVRAELARERGGVVEGGRADLRGH